MDLASSLLATIPSSSKQCEKVTNKSVKNQIFRRDVFVRMEIVEGGN